MDEVFTVDYVESQSCKTVVASGFVLSASVPNPELLQLTAYADLSSLKGETISNRGTTSSGLDLFEVTSQAKSVPYKEIQVRILTTRTTLKALMDLISKTLEQIEKELPEIRNGDKTLGNE